MDGEVRHACEEWELVIHSFATRLFLANIQNIQNIQWRIFGALAMASFWAKQNPTGKEACEMLGPLVSRHDPTGKEAFLSFEQHRM